MNYEITVKEKTFTFTNVENACIFFKAFEAFCRLRKIEMVLETNFDLDVYKTSQN